MSTGQNVASLMYSMQASRGQSVGHQWTISRHQWTISRHQNVESLMYLGEGSYEG